VEDSSISEQGRTAAPRDPAPQRHHVAACSRRTPPQLLQNLIFGTHSIRSAARSRHCTPLLGLLATFKQVRSIAARPTGTPSGTLHCARAQSNRTSLHVVPV